MSSQTNSFLTGPLGPIYARTALPIIFVMGMNGALTMIAIHFQAIGDAGRTANLGLSKPCLFVMPLTFALAGSAGEPGSWLAALLAEVLLVGLTGLFLAQVSRAQSLRWGLFTMAGEVRA